MQLEFKRFQREDYPAYASWFTDAELNLWLGPIDQAWLEATLAQPESEGVTWAVFHNAELIAVVETVFDPQQALPAGITAIATKPARRRQGIGTAVLEHLLALHKRQGIAEHLAYVAVDNKAGRRCLEKAGFVPVADEPNEHGYLAFQQRP